MRERKESAHRAEERKRAADQIDSEMRDQSAAQDRAFEDALEQWKTNHEAESQAESSQG